MKTINNIFYKTTLFALLLGLSQLSQAFVSYSLLKKGDQTILILGVAHNPPPQVLYQEWTDKLLKFFQSYETHNKGSGTPINCIYENADEFDPQLKKIHVYAQSTKAKQNFNFKNGDERNLDKTGILNGLLLVGLPRLLYNPILAGQNSQIYDYNLSSLQNFIDLQSLLTREPQIKIKDYLEHCLNQLKTFGMWKSQHNEYAQAFEAIYQKCFASFQEIEQILKTKNQDQTVVTTIMDHLSQFRFLAGSQEYTGILNLFVKNFDYLYADAGFLHHIAEQQKIGSKTIAIIGHDHATEINKHLMSIGFIQQAGMSIVSEVPDKYHNHIILTPIDVNSIDKFSAALFNILIDDILGLKPHICASCQKYSSDLISLSACTSEHSSTTTTSITVAAAAAATVASSDSSVSTITATVNPTAIVTQKENDLVDMGAYVDPTCSTCQLF